MCTLFIFYLFLFYLQQVLAIRTELIHRNIEIFADITTHAKVEYTTGDARMDGMENTHGCVNLVR